MAEDLLLKHLKGDMFGAISAPELYIDKMKEMLNQMKGTDPNIAELFSKCKLLNFDENQTYVYLAFRLYLDLAGLVYTISSSAEALNVPDEFKH